LEKAEQLQITTVQQNAAIRYQVIGVADSFR